MPAPRPQTPADRVGYRQGQLRSASAAQRRAEEVGAVVAARMRELEASEQRGHEAQAMVERVKKAREEVEAAVAKLQQASSDLRNFARRNPEESATSYLVFANAHLRVTGAFTSGLRRTASIDRVLNRAQAAEQAQRRRAEDEQRRLEARNHEREVRRLTLPTTDHDALAEVYGEMLNAD